LDEEMDAMVRASAIGNESVDMIGERGESTAFIIFIA
jgi:hypothetical protein